MNMKRPLWILPALLSLILVSACDSTSSDDTPTPVVTGILVTNQGNFSDANGSITLHDPRTGTTSTFLDNAGSTIQSLFAHRGNLYVLENSANRIRIISNGDWSTLGVLSPRYMTLVNDSLAYITSLFGGPSEFSGGKVFALDLNRAELVDSVTVGDNPEGVAVVDTLAFVANNGFGSGSTVSVIDAVRHEVVETVDVGCDGPRFVLADDDLDVWVLCTGATMYDGSGQVTGTTNGAIRIIDPETRSIVERIDLDGQIATAGPGQDAVLSLGLQQLFVVLETNRIVRFDTRSNDQIAEFGPVEGAPIGAIGFEPINERVYLGHVPGFTESGQVTIHNLQGDQVDSFTAGVAPTYFLFQSADN